MTIPYQLSKHLRKKGIEVKLFIDSLSEEKSYLPEWEDEDIEENGLPNWIYKERVSLYRYFGGFKEEREFLNCLSDCDLIHTHGEASIWGSFTKKPYVFQSYGFDLCYMPFLKGSLKQRILSSLMRRGIRKASKILILPYQIPAIKRLGISYDRYSNLYCGIDTQKYKRADASLGNELREKFKVDLILFSPTRHQWTNSEITNKGNDSLIRAIHKFLKGTKQKSLFIFVEKGSDVAKSKSLIDEMGIKDNILWIEPVNKKKLIEYYSNSDIVLDQFVEPGELGQITLEAMSVGVPTFIYLTNPKGYFEESPPVVNVSTTDEIASEMLRFADNPELRIEVGNKSREWILKYRDWNIVVDKYISLYKEILGF